MNKEQIQQIIDLIKKTGDKLIVLDQKSGAFVMMDIKDYEKLVLAKSEVKDLTEDELLDKINRDIASWKTSQNQEPELDKPANYDKIKENQNYPDLEETSLEERFYVEPEG